MSYILELLNSIMNTVTLGTYPVRPFLLLGYGVLIILAATTFPYLHKRISISTRVRAGLDQSLRILALASLTLLFLIPIVSEVAVFHSFGIPQSSLGIFFAGDEITSTRIAHNHFGKTAIAQFFGYGQSSIVQASDTGAALLPYMPAWLPPVEAVLFVIALLCSLYIAARFVATIFGRTNKAWAMALCTLIGFLMLEKSLDGGFVSDGAGIACVAYVILIFFHAHYFYKAVLYATLGYLWLISVLYVTGFYSPQSYILYTAIRSGVLLLSIFALYRVAKGKRDQMLLLLAISAIASIAILSYTQGKWDRAYLQMPLTPGSSYLTAYTSELPPAFPLQKIGTVGNLSIYNPMDTPYKTVGAMVAAYSLPYWYRPLTSDVLQCSGKITARTARFTIYSSAPLQNVPAKPGVFADAQFVPMSATPNGWYAYQAEVAYHPCISRYLNVIQETVHTAGSDRFIVFGLTIHSQATPE
ncbi:MAG: hypothetical protein JWL75_542 [Parcubacteria group bacterium]|nr:hypothetical protein [Parcubacteria group bacterium]